MRLNKKQIESVGDALVEKGIVYRDFYDELLDHLCSTMEAKMTDGLEFKNALRTSLVEMSDLKSKGSVFSPFRSVNIGLKVLQHSRYKAIDSKVKRELLTKVSDHVFNYRVFFWLLLFIIILNYAPFSFSIDIMFGGGFLLGLIGYLGIVVLLLSLSNDSLMDFLHNSSFKYFANKMVKEKLVRKAESDATFKLFTIPIILLYTIVGIGYLDINPFAMKLTQAILIVLLSVMLVSIWQLLKEKKVI